MIEWQYILVGVVALCALFGVAFLACRRANNYGFCDVVWSYSFVGVAVYCANAAHGWPTRRMLITALVAIWSLRLGTHLCRRVVRHHPTEDARYQKLRKSWGDHFTAKMAGMFLIQGLSVAILAIPLWLACRDPYPHVRLTEIAGAALWLVSLSGEALADVQLSAFARQPENKTKVCDVGLWHYSRHPNYFFETMIWGSIALISFASPLGYFGLLSPAIMAFLLLRVTGVPMAEELSLRKRGEAYRRYQASTSAFIPWFPKSGPSAN